MKHFQTSPYGDALLGIMPRETELRLDEEGNLLLLIPPDAQEINSRDEDQLLFDSAVLEVLKDTVVSDAVRAQCEAEMREAAKRNWIIRD